MVSTLRTVARVAGFGLLALLLSACLKLDMNLEVSSDDTVSGSVVFAVEKSLLELAGGNIEDVLGTDAPLPEDLEGVTVEDYEDDEFAGQRFTFDAVPLDEFNSDGDEDQLQIVRDGDTFRVSGALDLSTGATGASGVTGLEGIDPEQFLQSAELRIRITFPGEVTDSNGDVDGNTVTWTPEIGERLEIEATASAVGGGDSNLTLWLVIGAVVVVAAVVIGVVLARRRGTPAVAAADAGVPGATPAPAPEPAPPTTPEPSPEAPPPPRDEP
jgi:hypothetical protein